MTFSVPSPSSRPLLDFAGKVLGLGMVFFFCSVRGRGKWREASEQVRGGLSFIENRRGGNDEEEEEAGGGTGAARMSARRPGGGG